MRDVGVKQILSGQLCERKLPTRERGRELGLTHIFINKSISIRIGKDTRGDVDGPPDALAARYRSQWTRLNSRLNRVDSRYREPY